MFLQEKKEKTEFKTVQQKPEKRPGFANAFRSIKTFFRPGFRTIQARAHVLG
jgi:hypothetical protein